MEFEDLEISTRVIQMWFDFTRTYVIHAGIYQYVNDYDF